MCDLGLILGSPDGDLNHISTNINIDEDKYLRTILVLVPRVHWVGAHAAFARFAEDCHTNSLRSPGILVE